MIGACIFNRKGFTLIELIVVLLILTIAMSIAIPSFNNFLADYQLDAACRQLQQEIRSTGQDALADESSTYQINLYVRDDKYRMIDLSKPGVYREVVMPGGVDIVYTNFENDIIKFTPKGMPTSGGHISLRSRKTGKYQYVIVAVVTGRTRISDYPPEGNE
ncbi:prepilin-type N-terminal cleavage/methylation domain-containing protein [Desulfallas sp. Bu1-1]|uniref:prepilin-type N-terminal cleavage/methylation domain-containing protein n=1 Tax=Desulfallas sp. Bu1-1 TaxID=2787620 RepID=UPI00189D1800|nr:prepilin-type N-terminal cleavage/methylation domain-containing protein [Desulfallas sp. Bu1-1]MBF7082132.1 prepilin-type N-terminal cleavage/methylation domain-containing protein [Desulfallas sp. Bu1-1]